MTHTPTPWNARGLAICKGNSLIAVMGQDDGIKFSEKTSLANASHIVKCVNLHDELVKALELALQYLVYDGKHPAVVSAKTAIAKAREEA